MFKSKIILNMTFGTFGASWMQTSKLKLQKSFWVTRNTEWRMFSLSIESQQNVTSLTLNWSDFLRKLILKQFNVFRLSWEKIVIINTDGSLDGLNTVRRHFGQERLVISNSSRSRRRICIILLEREVEDVRQRFQNFCLQSLCRDILFWLLGQLLEGVKLGLREKTLSCKGEVAFAHSKCWCLVTKLSWE